MKTKLEDMDNQQLARAIKIRKRQIFADIVLVIFLLWLGIYIARNIAYIKLAESVGITPCQAYLEKIGMQCMAKFIP